MWSQVKGDALTPATTKGIFERLRTGGENGGYWSACGAHAIADVRDLTTGFDSSVPDGVATLPASKSTEMITFTLANGATATLRTSGTEPKVKYYVEMDVDGASVGPQAAQAQVAALARTIVDEMLQPDVHGLELS